MLSTDTIAFGNVFPGATRSVPVIIKNQGTADVNIASMVFVNDVQPHGWSTNGDPVRALQKYSIAIPTTSFGIVWGLALDKLCWRHAWYHLCYGSGGCSARNQCWSIIAARNVDIRTNQQPSVHDSKSGQANLEVSATGAQWLSFEADEAATDFTYSVEAQRW